MTKDEEQMIANLMHRMHANEQARIESALATARMDAVTRAEADRVRIEALSEDLRKEREAHAETADLLNKADAKVRNMEHAHFKRLTGFNTTPAGEIGRVTRVDDDAAEIEYEVKRPNGETGVWCAKNCEPCDPPEATHITPDGKATAQAAVTPQPGDVVRLVRVPTNDEYPHDSGRWEPNWGGIGDYMRVHYVGSNINGTRVVRAVFGLEWPLSCVEVVKGGEQ